MDGASVTSVLRLSIMVVCFFKMYYNISMLHAEVEVVSPAFFGILFIFTLATSLIHSSTEIKLA